MMHDLATLRGAHSATFSAMIGATLLLGAGCATVKVEAPDEPIEINLNVNIQQEVRIKMEREVEDLITQNPDIF